MQNNFSELEWVKEQAGSDNTYYLKGMGVFSFFPQQYMSYPLVGKYAAGTNFPFNLKGLIVLLWCLQQNMFVRISNVAHAQAHKHAHEKYL